MLSLSVRGTSFPQILTRLAPILISEQCRNEHTLFRHGLGNKHHDPKWKKHRANKVIRVKLPDFERMRSGGRDNLDRNEIRAEQKKYGVQPCRHWEEQPVFISTLSGIIEPYVPPEGDGKATLLSKDGAFQKMEQLKKKTSFMWFLRKLKQYEPEFKVTDFAADAHDIYVKAHAALADADKEKLHALVTEAAFPEMIANVRMKTIRWKMLGSLEPPRVVQVRTQSLLAEDNVFAQITVRLHTQQTLAVYDRFGRLMHGSEALVKDVLEYVVFEKQIANIYGTWRLHGKIIPNWQPKKEPSKRTFIEKDTEEPADPVPDPPVTTQDGETVEKQAAVA